MFGCGIFLKILCVWLFLLACMSVYLVRASCPWKSEKALRCRGNVMLNVCEPVCGCRESSIGPFYSQDTSSAPRCCFVMTWIPLPLCCAFAAQSTFNTTLEKERHGSEFLWYWNAWRVQTETSFLLKNVSQCSVPARIITQATEKVTTLSGQFPNPLLKELFCICDVWIPILQTSQSLR